MQFNSYAFLLFFAVVFPLYCILNFRWQNRLLLAASYLFYGLAEPRFLAVMFATTVVDYYIGIRIADSPDPRVRKKWMILSVTMNLVMLGFFKYCDFFIESIAATLAKLGLSATPAVLGIVAPAGISFYTFHEISYTVDVYRGHIKPARRFEDFAVFISFFPQLVAGPIGRASWQMPQFEKPRRVTWEGWCEGALLILIGYFKKICVADVFALLTQGPFKEPQQCSGAMLLCAVYFFAFQIYADFSGYTDIARGLAKLMGFELIENFNQPYFASNITDFWRRWHISLSTWLRDYLYIPLGGNRKGEARTYVNLFLTMFLGGLWHGAAWRYAVWGALHGLYLAVHKFMLRIFSPAGKAQPEIAKREFLPVKLVKVAATFNLVCLTWVFFGPDSMAAAKQILWRIFSAFGAKVKGGLRFDQHDLIVGLCAAAVLFLLIDLPQFLKRDHCTLLRWPLVARATIYTMLFVWIVATRALDNVPFIYFQF